MIMKKFNYKNQNTKEEKILLDTKRKFIKKIFKNYEFISLLSDIAFGSECTSYFRYDNHVLKFELKNTMVVNRLLNKKISDSILLISFDNGYTTPLPTTKVQSLSYDDFINFLVSIAPNDFIDMFYLDKCIQLSIGDIIHGIY